MNMQDPANMSILNNVTWAVSNLCRGKPAPDMALVAPAIEPLTALLHKEVSVDVQVDAVWALSYLSDGPNDRIERVMQTGVTAKLVEFLKDKTSLLLIPTIRCLGNFVTGSDVQTQAVLDAGILKHLSELLDSPRRTIRKESCWLASNISAGKNQQISLLMHQPGVMQ
jgi:importin subunit alpha-1